MLVIAGVARLVHRRRGSKPVVVVHEHAHSVHEVHGAELAQHAVAVSVPVGAGAGAPAGSAHHSHAHVHIASMPADPFLSYGRLTAFGVGMLHGVGAETPTQILLFLAAASAGGKGAGLLLLLVFVVGLLISNSLIATASTFGFLRVSSSFAAYATVSVVIALFSLVIGTVFLFGHGGVLPTILGS